MGNYIVGCTSYRTFWSRGTTQHLRKKISARGTGRTFASGRTLGSRAYNVKLARAWPSANSSHHSARRTHGKNLQNVGNRTLGPCDNLVDLGSSIPLDNESDADEGSGETLERWNSHDFPRGEYGSRNDVDNYRALDGAVADA